MKDKIKLILREHCRYCSRLDLDDATGYNRCKNDIEDQEERILAAFREYVEEMKPRPLMGKHGKEEQEWIDAALGIYEQSLLSGLTEEKE